MGGRLLRKDGRKVVLSSQRDTPIQFGEENTGLGVRKPTTTTSVFAPSSPSPLSLSFLNCPVT